MPILLDKASAAYVEKEFRVNISEKWAEIEWALSAQPLGPLTFEKAPDSEPGVYQFIVTDNSSKPVTDFNNYAELE